MEAFTFCSPTKFILQTDADLLCGKEAKQYTDRVLFVHYGDEFTYQSGLYDRVTQSLEREGITYFELPAFAPIQKPIWSAGELKLLSRKRSD